MNAIKLAVLFHELYEKYAPEYGYETKEDTKIFKSHTPNGKLMIRVCREIQKHVNIEEGNMPYREPLTEDEKLMKKDGWNVDEDNDPNKDEMRCICGWIGTRGQLMSATGLKDDVEYIYCPECGSDDVGEV